MLLNLRCLNEDGKLTNAGVLFFSDTPEFLILQSKVSAVLFQGTKNITILDRKDFCSGILSNIEDCMIFLRKHLNLAYKIEHLKCEEILEIPEIALREAVVNALCHRSYFEKGANAIIQIFADRVEISNPGGLPSGLNKEMFGRKSVTRNPIIAELLHRAGYIEKIGTGIQRIRDVVSLTKTCDVNFEISEHWFTTIFYRQKEINNVIDNVTDKNSRLRQILVQMRDNPKITTNELARIFAVSKRTIIRDLEELKISQIERVGSERDGFWKIID